MIFAPIHPNPVILPKILTRNFGELRLMSEGQGDVDDEKQT